MNHAESTLAYKDPDHACNQGSLIQLANGDLLLGFNQERSRPSLPYDRICRKISPRLRNHYEKGY